ncbi:hypothetical protein O1611_g2256 [Lasiodiplodia mahajangana]|uniref:Uncharacterized protein n=1 Tax=Lasiodiplodia mahajangana TaxID=1108764 RepID=A0ACC2JVL3_9PEZI|nr:hypothetical protein O1611_g2256 [Lasiodiplodia mahajangana]
MEPPLPSVQTLTEECIAKFEDLITLRPPRRIELECRLADLNLWADGVGALLKPGASLNSSPWGRISDLAVVRNVLNMLAESLDYCKEVDETEASFEESIQNVDFVIENLTLIGVAIQGNWKASRNRGVDQTFDPDAYSEFRTHLQCIVLLRPTQETRFSQMGNGDCVTELDPAKLTPLQSRLIDANLRRRHKFCVAQKATNTQLLVPAEPFVTSNPLPRSPSPNVQNVAQSQGSLAHLVSDDPSHPAPIVSRFSLASTAEGTLQYKQDVTKNNSEPAKTQITSITSNTEFPQYPPLPLGRQVAKCPCCCQSLPVEDFRNSTTWK